MRLVGGVMQAPCHETAQEVQPVGLRLQEQDLPEVYPQPLSSTSGKFFPELHSAL